MIILSQQEISATPKGADKLSSEKALVSYTHLTLPTNYSV